NDPHRPGGEPAVATRLFFRCCLQHRHRGTLFLRGERGAERRIAAADHDDVSFGFCHAGPRHLLELLRHARTCPAHPRLAAVCLAKTWMGGASPPHTRPRHSPPPPPPPPRA